MFGLKLNKYEYELRTVYTLGLYIPIKANTWLTSCTSHFLIYQSVKGKGSTLNVVTTTCKHRPRLVVCTILANVSHCDYIITLSGSSIW